LKRSPALGIGSELVRRQSGRRLRRPETGEWACMAGLQVDEQQLGRGNRVQSGNARSLEKEPGLAASSLAHASLLAWRRRTGRRSRAWPARGGATSHCPPAGASTTDRTRHPARRRALTGWANRKAQTPDFGGERRSGRGSASAVFKRMIFLKRIGVNSFRVYTRTRDFRSTQRCTICSDFAQLKVRLRGKVPGICDIRYPECRLKL